MANPTTPIPRQAWSVLIVSTIAFTVCFMVWMMFGVIGIPLKKTLGLNATEFGLLTATPVLTGSLIRVPLGIWTDRYGGRVVMTWLMAATVLLRATASALVARRCPGSALWRRSALPLRSALPVPLG